MRNHNHEKEFHERKSNVERVRQLYASIDSLHENIRIQFLQWVSLLPSEYRLVAVKGIQHSHRGSSDAHNERNSRVYDSIEDGSEPARTEARQKETSGFRRDLEDTLRSYLRGTNMRSLGKVVLNDTKDIIKSFGFPVTVRDSHYATDGLRLSRACFKCTREDMSLEVGFED